MNIKSCLLSACVLLTVDLLLSNSVLSVEPLLQVSTVSEVEKPIDEEVDFTAREIKITGNSILKAELEQLVNKYEGRTLNYQQLYRLKQEISELYVRKGYPNSGAYIPPQKIKDGKVNLVVLEGGIGEIKVDGLSHLSENYVRSRLGKLKAPLEAEELIDKLYVLRQDPLIEDVSAELAAGVNPGESVLDITVTEAKPWNIGFELNNQKSPATGNFSRGTKLDYLNLLGFGDSISFGYTNTEGSNSVDFGYQLPYSSRGKLSFNYGFNNNDIVEEVFNPLDIESQSNFWSLGLAQDILVKSNHNFNLSLQLTRQHSETTLLDSPFALALGADAEGNTNVTALRFAQNYTNRGQESIFAARSQLSLGIDAFDATVTDNDNLPDGKFFSWLGQTQYVRNLNDDFPVVLRGDLQLSPSELVSLEQFRLGGGNTVRGYRRDLLLGDNALLLSAETRVPVAKWRKIDGLLQIAPFIDYGTVWNNDDNLALDTSSLVSVGLGLNFAAFGDRLRARLDWGIPLTDVEVDNQPVTFNLKYGF
ncbi:MAG: ShlB/FhaC/HecB family hemolysin secretion/activation protein [Waterburya sp.]